MKRFHSSRPSGAVLVPLLTAVLLSAGVASAQKSEARLAGPSVAMGSEAVQFAGTGFAPNQAVSIAIKGPNGHESVYSAVTTAQGTLQVKLAASTQGAYSVRVLSTAGKPLAQANLVAHR